MRGLVENVRTKIIAAKKVLIPHLIAKTKTV